MKYYLFIEYERNFLLKIILFYKKILVLIFHNISKYLNVDNFVICNII